MKPVIFIETRTQPFSRTLGSREDFESTVINKHIKTPQVKVKLKT